MSRGYLHHVSQRPTRVVHEVEVVLHAEERDQRVHDLAHGKSYNQGLLHCIWMEHLNLCNRVILAGKGVFVSHDEKLTHFDHGLKLSRFVSRRGESDQELLSLLKKTEKLH